MLYAEDVDSIRYSRFNASRPTKFICHGFVDDGNARWIKVSSLDLPQYLYGMLTDLVLSLQRLTRNLLDHGDYNVITVNWGGGSLPLGGLDIYTQATANTRVVGLEIGYLVNVMIVCQQHFLLNLKIFLPQNEKIKMTNDLSIQIFLCRNNLVLILQMSI